MHSEITEDYLLDLVKGLSPTKEIFAGKKFLEIHIREKGVDATINFINKVIDILDDEEDLNKEIDLEEDELAILKRSAFNNFTRRNFLRVGAWATCGIPITIYGAARTVQNIGEYTGLSEPEKEAVEATNAFGEFIHFFGKHIMPPAEAVCGPALTYEAIDKYNILKLKQVSRAVTKLGDKIKEQHQGIIIEP